MFKKRSVVVYTIISIIAAMFSISFSGTYISAENLPPAYSSDTDEYYNITSYGNGSYSNGVLTVPDKSNSFFGTNLSSDASYYMSLDVVAAGTYVNIGYRSGNGYIQLQNAGYNSVGTSSGWVGKSIPTLKTTGVHVTIFSTSTHVKIWIGNEMLVDEDLSTGISGNSAKPGITWNAGSVTVKNICIWGEKQSSNTDTKIEPVYNVENCKNIALSNSNGAYNGDNLVYTSSCSDIFFGEINNDEINYYTSMIVKTNGYSYVNLTYRTTSNGYFQIAKTKYASPATGLAEQSVRHDNIVNGIRVTMHVTKTHLQVWVEGELLIDDDITDELTLSSNKTRFGFSWIQKDLNVEISDYKVWTLKSNEPLTEPVFNSETDTSYKIKDYGNGVFSNNILTIKDQDSSFFATKLENNASYYMSFDVIANGTYVNIAYRSGDGYIQLQSSGYNCVGVQSGWVSKTNSTLKSTGTHVTVYSSPNSVKIWIDGENIINSDLDKKVLGNDAKPGISWNAGGAYVNNIIVWTNGKTDEPFYEEETDYIYTPQKYTSGTVNENELIIPKETKSLIISDLPFNADYYMTLNVKATKSVNIGFRDGDGYLNLNTNGYNCPAIKTGWTEKSFAKLPYGIRITLYSAKDHLSIWVNGEKIIDSEYKNSGNTAPSIAWTFDNEVTVNDITIWTKEIFISDEPIFDKSKDTKVGFYGFSKSEKTSNGFVTKPLTQSHLISDLDFDSDYYMSFVVKTLGAVNIGYRNPDGAININSTGYKSIGTDGEWISKRFDLLSTGIRVTIHSSKDHISIWVNGENLIDQPYLKDGETYPGISWTFDNDVTVNNVIVWTNAIEDNEFLGAIESTKSTKKQRDLINIPNNQNNSIISLDISVIGKDYVKTKSDVEFGSIKAEKHLISKNKDYTVMIIAITSIVTVVLVGLSAFLIFKRKRKS